MIFEVLEGENVSFAMSDYYRRQLSDTMMLIDDFVFCDQDDVWMPDKLKVVAVVDQLKDEDHFIPLICYSNTILVDVNLGVIREAWD